MRSPHAVEAVLVLSPSGDVCTEFGNSTNRADGPS